MQNQAPPADFPYPLVTVHGSEAESELKRLLVRGPSEGFSPVILGHAEQFEHLMVNFRSNETSVPDLLKAAEEVDPRDWFRQQAGELGMGDDDDGDSDEEPIGYNRLTVPFHALSGKPHPQVFIALIPTTNSWEIPAYLKAGGWNECPGPEVQVAVARYWKKDFGADIVCLSGDVSEYLVANPPMHNDEADQLALEHYYFCPDIVRQEVGSISNLSQVLLDGRYWHFWWD